MSKLLLIPFIILNYSVFANDFTAIDSIIISGIESHYYPGAQLLIGNGNTIIYNKCFGTQTYDSDSPLVTDNTIFDIASLTKVVATTPAIMRLYEMNQLNLDDKIIKYIPEFNNNKKDNITILNLLLHNSGLTAYIPFYKFYSSKKEVKEAICNLGLEYETNTYCVYSDLNFVLLQLIIEKITGENLQAYCRREIFEPLNMSSTMFNPSENLREYIAPTEYDSYWRNKQIKGEVHDETAYILGGVSGNAGLFSNALDLYKYAKMLINKGKYYNPYTRGLKEEILFKETTVEFFTTPYKNLLYKNTRSPGWETKPEQKDSRIPCGELISENSFGQTGYTGTSLWCDKDRNIIIIFLTNRIYPSRYNNGIKEIRPELHNLIIKTINSNKY